MNRKRTRPLSFESVCKVEVLRMSHLALDSRIKQQQISFYDFFVVKIDFLTKILTKFDGNPVQEIDKIL